MFDLNHHYFSEFTDPSVVPFVIPFGRLMFRYATLRFFTIPDLLP